jgi:hypothetical protein
MGIPTLIVINQTLHLISRRMQTIQMFLASAELQLMATRNLINECPEVLDQN